MKMVGFWNLGLRMIPNDRPRLGRGPPVDFGPNNSIFFSEKSIFSRNKSQTIMKNHDFSKDFDTNGWGPAGLAGPAVPAAPAWPTKVSLVGPAKAARTAKLSQV